MGLSTWFENKQLSWRQEQNWQLNALFFATGDNVFRSVKLLLIPAGNNKMASLKWRFAQWLERRWWRNYLRHKSASTYLNDKRAYWNKILGQLEFKIVEQENVLDAGCGPAGIFMLLHERQQVTALDPLLEHYAEDLEIFDPAMYPEVKFIASPLETAILASVIVAYSSALSTNQSPEAASFRTIYCFNAVNHVDDWALALDRLSEWADVGTTMLLSSDVHRRPWLKTIFRLLPGDLLHPQQHGRQAYRAAFTQRGWRIEKEVLLRRELIFDYVGWKLTKI